MVCVVVRGRGAGLSHLEVRVREHFGVRVEYWARRKRGVRRRGGGSMREGEDCGGGGTERSYRTRR